MGFELPKLDFLYVVMHYTSFLPAYKLAVRFNIRGIIFAIEVPSIICPSQPAESNDFWAYQNKFKNAFICDIF